MHTAYIFLISKTTDKTTVKDLKNSTATHSKNILKNSSLFERFESTQQIITILLATAQSRIHAEAHKVPRRSKAARALAKKGRNRLLPLSYIPTLRRLKMLISCYRKEAQAHTHARSRSSEAEAKRRFISLPRTIDSTK